ncbi:hypothetical protein QCA50_010482 [Cerrena zonata]|uniref:Serine/threonine-protein kinase Tel1 n=1 Tax=Cerrena zonata TaxID=2478898 RepID=A0AAW0G8U1_9APHY
MERTIHAIRAMISSDKVRDRQEGLKKLQDVIQQENAVLALGLVVKGTKLDGWQLLFTALFDAFSKEHAACLKTGKEHPINSFDPSQSKLPVRRLCEVASTLRKVIERGVQRINNKAIDILIPHLVRGCQYDGRFIPVSLDYAKSLKCLLNWKPHLQHLNDHCWYSLARLSLNAVLGDPLRGKLTYDESSTGSSQAAREDTPDTQTTISDQASQDDDDNMVLETPTGSKRRRSEKRPSPRLLPKSSSSSTVKQDTAISLEQIEFISILAIIFESQNSPLAAKLEGETKDLRPAIMERMVRFLYRFQPDSSLHHDYLRALKAILDNVALNERALTVRFARDAWSGLLMQWSTKNQSVKEQLIIVLKMLFPYLTAGHEEESHATQVKLYDDLSALWQRLRRETDRRGVEGLSLDSLRLSTVTVDATSSRSGPFIANTFRHGWAFDANQATVWAIFELQADCAEKLHLMSESMHSSSMTGTFGKRRKRADPIEELLDSTSLYTADNVRGYHLQSLLFFIDRHWPILHVELRKAVAVRLQGALSIDDPLTQSWTIMCLGAIAYAEAINPALSHHSLTPSQLSSDECRIPWDEIWQQVMRKTSTVAVSRTACHTANILLSYSKILLNSHKILTEVEVLTKDVHIQGPSYPYDSVCAFLISCMRIASHDVRLYRLRLEEKVLQWFMDTWRPGGVTKSRLCPYIVDDIISLLATVCNIARRADVLSLQRLPMSRMVEAIVTEYNNAVIRDFLLDARLPPYTCDQDEYQPRTGQTVASSLGDSAVVQTLAVPGGRERKISSYLLKSLEELADYWDTNKDSSLQFPAERVRTYLDLAVIALCFEGSLVQNGTQSNRRVLQAACKLLTLMVSTSESRRWSELEKGVIVASLEPLILDELPEISLPPWETLLAPGPDTGIRFEMLNAVRKSSHEADVRQKAVARRELQRTVMQSSDVQDAIAIVLEYLRSALRHSLDQSLSTHHGSDGFGQFKHSTIEPFVDDSTANSDSRPFVDICISALSALPAIHSATGEATRDKALIQIIEECPDHLLPLISPAFLHHTRLGTLSVKLNTVITILTTVGTPLLGDYHNTRSEALHCIIMEVLDATMHIWLHPTVDDELQDHVSPLLEWLLPYFKKGKMRSWKCRDRLLRFFDHYFQRDRLLDAWSWPVVKNVPMEILYPMLNDFDIRVRLRASAVVPRCFTVEGFARQHPLAMYRDILETIPRALNEYENMLTRLIMLGNLMIVSSAVRRGTYWHFLETCLRTPEFNQHITAVLQGLATRFGFSSFSQLFEVYASQLAYSIRQHGYDVLRIPPHLIGYQDRRQGAEACFHIFTPTNILAGTIQAKNHGRNLFERHCQFVSKTVAQGIRECFAEIVGFQIVTWMKLHQHVDDIEHDNLMIQLRLTTKDLEQDHDNDEDYFLTYLTEYSDGIVVTILRTLGDQDYSLNGPIVAELQQTHSDPNVVGYFLRMSKYRRAEAFHTHEPNLPSFDSASVLAALAWIGLCVPQDSVSGITYHVLHQLFAELNRSPLINEQLRIYNAITLWLSLHTDHVSSPDVLRTLINGATTTLLQSDVARCAQSLLEWVFSLLGSSSTDIGAYLAETLIRISCTAYDYTLHDDIRIADLGRELMDWIEGQAKDLCRHKTLRRQVLKALSTWPRELPENLMDVWEQSDPPDVSRLLGDQRVLSNKFRVVRRLHQLSLEDSYTSGYFSTTDFWRLKECMPAAGQLLDSDIDAFCDLLVSQKGQIDGLVNDSVSSNSVRARHIAEEFKKTANIDDAFYAAKKAIVLSLIDILDEPSVTRVQDAYITLKALVSHTADDAGRLQELDIFKPFPRAIPTRPQPTIVSLSLDAMYLDLATDFHRWITDISTFLNDVLGSVDPAFLSLSSMLQSNAHFAEQVIPVFVYCVLLLERSSHDIPNTRSSAETLTKYFTDILTSEFTSVECRRTIVDIVLHLRHFKPPNTNEALGYDKWLHIDYILLGHNALRCGAFTTALLFIQLASEYSSVFSLETEEVEDILHEIYRHIDEPDGFYGIKTNDLSSFLIKRLQHEQQWEKAFQFHGAGLEAGLTGTADVEGAVLALHNFGFNNLAIQTLHGPAGHQDGIPSSSMAYRLGWRTDTWDLPETTNWREPGVALYVALRAVERERDNTTIDSIVRNALREEMDHLRDLGNEDVRGIRQVTQSLMCLNQISSWRGKKLQGDLEAQDVTGKYWAQISHVDLDFQFSDLESILAVRRSLLRLTSRREIREQIGNISSSFRDALQDLEAACLLRLSEAARHHEQAQIALNSITAAQRLQSSLHFEVAQEFAQVLWLTKEPKYAVQHLRNALSGLEQGTTDQKLRKALLLSTLGTWTSEACLEKPAFVMSQYFSPAVAMLDSHPDTKDSATAYHQFALFADRQYHTMMKSPDAIRMKLYVERKRKEVEERKKARDNSQSHEANHGNAKRALERAEKVLQEDEHRYDEHVQAQVTFLKQAVTMYSRSLAVSDDFDDDSAVRLCSLWFANFDFDKGEFQSELAAAVAQVPSRKLVFLAHQLTARLAKVDSSSKSAGQVVLQPLLKRMCREHPFHSLYQVFCIQSDGSGSSSDRRRSGRSASSMSQADRAAAAISIFDQLLSDNTSQGRTKDIRTLCEASLSFANHPLKELYKNKRLPSSIPIPGSQRLRTIQNLRVPVMTIDTPLDPTSRYDDCVWVQRYESHFSTAGGLNLPKIAICVGSNGKSYKQLFKGEGGDDLRQDAVMEQVFELVNVMLKRDKATRRRYLNVRSYKVIPLATQAGVLEFVDHTTPLMKWLDQAHTLYHPKGLPRTRWGDVEILRKKNDPVGARDMFRKFWDNVQPVMRHYFTERHKTPMSWFRLRLNYARSVATTSIVGHVLGLGDRHTSNILLDNHTGEVVHIDLGIAFDQGKLLPVPEKVPFRLTRDMIDGLGVTGTQGVFQRCSEETLRVLRDRSEVITTVLEVFKYDPLHSWTASELKVKRAQTGETISDFTAGEAIRQVIGLDLLDMSSGIAHEAADRAITSVIRKLDKTLTVEFTVNELISEATDMDNLANMYYGWGALW